MSTVEIETGRFVKRFEFWNPSTWAIPALYWDTFSQEQRIHAICRQLGKVIAYADYVGVNVDDIAARLKAIEEGQLNDLIVAAIEEWFEEHQPIIVEAITQLQEDMEQAQNDIDALETFTAGILGSESVAEDFNADEAKEEGTYAFNIRSAAKCKYNDTVYYNYEQTTQQTRVLILPLHDLIFRSVETLGVIMVQKANETLIQTLSIPEAGCMFSRIGDGDTWEDWNYCNANITPNGADDETMNAIIGVSRTYIESPITYQHYGANWYDTTVNGTPVQSNVGTENEGLDCSGFVEMVMNGVPYEQSRFNGESDNVLGFANFCFDMYGGNQALREKNNLALTNQKAEWLRDNGYGFHPNGNFSNLKPGDVFFLGDPEQYANRWMGIYHCGIFIGFAYASGGASSYAITAEVAGSPGDSNVARIWLRQIGTFFNDMVYVARVPYGSVQKYQNLPKTYCQAIPCGYTGSTAQQTLKEALPNHEMFCVEFDGMLPALDDKFTLYVKDADSSLTAASTTRAITTYEVNEWKHYKFILPTYRTDITGITAISISGPSGCKIRNAIVYNSYKPDIVPCPYFNIPSTTNILDYMTDIIAHCDGDRFIAHTASSLTNFTYGGEWNGEIRVYANTGDGVIVLTHNDSNGIRFVVVTVTDFVATAIAGYTVS